MMASFLTLASVGWPRMLQRTLIENYVPSIRFRVSQSDAWLETRGRIAWISLSKRTAGIEFMGIPFESRIRLKRWISTLTLEGTTASVEDFVMKRSA